MYLSKIKTNKATLAIMDPIRFRTEVELKPGSIQIDHNMAILLLGSCFTDHIGEKLKQLKFNALINPFGVVYNPVSLLHQLERFIDQNEFITEELLYHQGMWHSMDLHGSFSRVLPETLIQETNRELKTTGQFLKKADLIIITFGTAWVYRHLLSGKIINNCHKLPENMFSRFRISVGEIVSLWEEKLDKLLLYNPKLKVLFTVSPVRHFRDGAHENQLSKSTLLLAIDQLQKGRHSEIISYFPSYELIMDELRDYRFYAEDMVHLNEVAVKFIFEKFKTIFFSPSTRQISDDIQKIVTAMQHRLLNQNQTETQKFAQSILSKIKILVKQNANINLKSEMDYFESLAGNRE